MRIAIIGGGYVGLVSGACLASKGHDIIVVENNIEKVNLINEGKSPIHENGLNKILQENAGHTLQATTQLDSAVQSSDVTILAVGTPFVGDEIDLSQIERATTEVGQALRNSSRYHLVVVKSTVVPGTTDDLVAPLLQLHSGKRVGVEIGVGMNPEFLREGSAVSDFMEPDRIVIGGCDDRARKRLASVYEPFCNADKMYVGNRTAEMIKYASNSLLATLISFSNEMGNLCSSIENVNVADVLAGVKLDKRLSPILQNGERVSPEINTYLEAGCGFGGSCFPKDVNALRAFGTQRSVSTPILDAVMQTNNLQPLKMLSLLRKRNVDVKGMNITVLGLAFKPGTDDVRESPALRIIEALSAMGANLTAFDPVAIDEAKVALRETTVTYANSMQSAVSDAEVILLVTSWPEFANLPSALIQLKISPLVIDGRGFLDGDAIENYECVGRGEQRVDTLTSNDTDSKDDSVSTAA